MEDKLKVKREELVNGLKHYFNNDMNKVKEFANSLKILGFNLNDLDTLERFELRSEAMIVLLGLFNFGALKTVTKSIEHLRGGENPTEYTNQYVEKFERIPPPQ